MLRKLIASVAGDAAAADLIDTLAIDAALTGEVDVLVNRSVFAMAMNALLLHQLLPRVPTGAAYVADRRAAGEKIVFDHGALRTIKFAEGPTGAWPAGHLAFARILEPLGYQLAGVYPLDRLKMTGRAYASVEHPETLPQFFVSELHVERFSPAFQAAAHRVFETQKEALGMDALTALAAFAAGEAISFDAAARALPEIVGAFARWHDEPQLNDYQTLLAESAEAAWISTEGSAFNHATDRVADVEATAARERAKGRPVKDLVEVSSSGRVRQTAYNADPVIRRFRQGDDYVSQSAPGSFFEFISRDPETPGHLDLRFDSSNAQGIFKMTASV